jgi:hypothetical protein
MCIVEAMTLELNDNQARELILSLESYLTTLLNEIVHADDRHFRDELKQRYDRLESLRARLSHELKYSEAVA